MKRSLKHGIIHTFNASFGCCGKVLLPTRLVFENSFARVCYTCNGTFSLNLCRYIHTSEHFRDDA